MGIRPKPRALPLAAASVALSLAATVCCDRIAGLSRNGEGLIFPPGSRMAMRTPEFDSLAEANSGGFRDREFTAEKRGKYRIAAVGDSFTFGWGVNAGSTWVKQLEHRLDRAGRGVEVLNLGQPGAQPADYAVTAAKAARLLNPDLLLVAALQGDDIAQLAAELTTPRAPSSTRARVSNAIRAVYPNLTHLASRAVNRAAESSQTATWKAQVAALTASSEGAATLASLDEHVRRLYRGGELNPAMLRLAIAVPGAWNVTLDPGSPGGVDAIRAASVHLAEVKRAAASIAAEVLVVSVPYRAYQNEFEAEAIRRLGFTLHDDILTSDGPDRAIRLACEAAGVPFASVSQEFRQRAAGRRLYFEFDSHFTADGHAVFAELLEPVIARRLPNAHSAPGP